MRGAIPPLPQYVFMVWCLVKHRRWLLFSVIRPHGLQTRHSVI